MSDPKTAAPPAMTRTEAVAIVALLGGTAEARQLGEKVFVSCPARKLTFEDVPTFARYFAELHKTPGA